MGTEMAKVQDRDTVKGLLPCPLCGGEVTLWNYEFGTVKVFECKACRTRFIFPWDKDVSEWNKRVPQTWTSKAFERIGEVNKIIEVAE